MSKEDYYYTNDDLDVPVWIHHQNFEFKSANEMLIWASDDKTNFKLSDKVYEAMIDCLKNDIEVLLVATLKVKFTTDVGIIIRKDNFQKILLAYTKRLLENESYEKLAQIKREVEKYGLEITK